MIFLILFLEIFIKYFSEMKLKGFFKELPLSLRYSKLSTKKFDISGSKNSIPPLVWINSNFLHKLPYCEVPRNLFFPVFFSPSFYPLGVLILLIIFTNNPYQKNVTNLLNFPEFQKGFQFYVGSFYSLIVDSRNLFYLTFLILIFGLKLVYSLEKGNFQSKK